MAAYYNENDPFAAAWLRGLIAEGRLAGGDVDERSVVDVAAGDLRGYSQCHFFAGIGGWPYALELAGWPAERPVWTGSCPCQPLSSAGQRRGHADERHLWPAFYALIAECRPATVFGEQVASRDGREWLAGIRADLEHLGYAVGAADLPAACVGAPHIRQRLFWVAHGADDGRREERAFVERLLAGDRAQGWGAGLVSGGATGGMADAMRRQPDRAQQAAAAQPDRNGPHDGLFERSSGSDGGMGHAGEPGLEERRGNGRVPCGAPGASEGEAALGAGAWAGGVWLPCLDGKARRVEPKYVKMVDGVSGRMGVGSTEREITDANMPELREDVGAQAVFRTLGGSDGIPAAEVLRSELHGPSDGRANQNPERAQFSQAVHKDSQGAMRDLHTQHNTALRSPSRRESVEQLIDELADFVRLLPSSLALAQLHGDTATAEALLAVLKASGTQRLLQYSSDAAEAAWRSLDGSERERLWHALGEAGIVRSMESPLAIAYPGRVGRLCAYGNAILPQVAAEFVRAFMECGG